jgi:hypothetical protein
MLKLINIFKDNFYHPLLCIHYIGIPVPSISGNKYKYLIFTIELHSHYIVQYRLLDKKPSKKNVEDILENISNVTSIKNVLFTKGSPFSNKYFTNVLKEKGFLYYHFSRDEYPEILSIVTAYLNRMIGFHIYFHSKIHLEFINKLIELWGKMVVPITVNLTDENRFIDKRAYREAKFSGTYEDGIGDRSYMDNYSGLNACQLFYNRIYDSKGSPLNLLVLCDLKSYRLEKLNLIQGYISEGDIIYFLGELLKDYSADYSLLLPNEEPFKSEWVQDYCNRNNISIIFMDENNTRLMEGFKKLKVAAQIANNYFKDYLRKVSPQEENKDKLIRDLESHWNSSVYTLIPHQVELATKIYS